MSSSTWFRTKSRKFPPAKPRLRASGFARRSRVSLRAPQQLLYDQGPRLHRHRMRNPGQPHRVSFNELGKPAPPTPVECHCSRPRYGHAAHPHRAPPFAAPSVSPNRRPAIAPRRIGSPEILPLQSWILGVAMRARRHPVGRRAEQWIHGAKHDPHQVILDEIERLGPPIFRSATSRWVPYPRWPAASAPVPPAAASSTRLSAS